MTTTTAIPAIASATASELEPVHRPAPAPDEQASSDSDSRPTPALQPPAERRGRLRKQPMKEFVWEVRRESFLASRLVLTGGAVTKGDLTRKTLPISTPPRWLDPL